MTYTEDIRAKARDLLTSGQVACVIGYELGPRGRTRPAFVTDPGDADRLVWNQHCTHNLTTYLRQMLHPTGHGNEPSRPVAVIVKACDSRAINVLLVENQITRDLVHVIGVACDGILDGAGFSTVMGGELQARCRECGERTPVVCDTLIGEPSQVEPVDHSGLDELDAMTPAARAAFWLDQFDRCIRCYACRQACPMCNCPTCLYERDDSLWSGMGIGLDEKRTFHLGRAYHLAGRCVGCDECERVCPMDIPIGLLNRKLAREMEALFGYRAGLKAEPSPITTILEEG
jgi:formate dehydrogenase subunit beta